MKIKVLVLSGLLVLGACAPQNLARLVGTSQEISTGNFEYIGCHTISANDDKWAMGYLSQPVPGVLAQYKISDSNFVPQGVHDLLVYGFWRDQVNVGDLVLLTDPVSTVLRLKP